MLPVLAGFLTGWNLRTLLATGAQNGTKRSDNLHK